MDTEKAPRSELLKTIEHQKDLILRREQRLRDVISAYKGVCKEKEALESSIRVLSQTKIKGQLGIPQRKELSSATDLRLESNKEIEDGNTENLKSSDALNSKFQSFEVSSSDKDELQQQVETLSHSIFTLTQEKSKLEATYIAEKKTMKQENEDLQKKVKDLLEKTEKLENDISQEQLEWKNRVRSLQVEREKQQTDHAVMLRELQKLLTNERHAKEQIEQQSQTERSHALSAREKVLIALRYYASGSFMQTVGDTLGRDKSTVSRIITSVTDALCDIKDQYIKWPNDVSLNKSSFYRVSGFPNVIGCIDGTHVRILKPGGERQRAYINRKRFPSINVMGVVDHSGKFINVNAKWPGSAHDSFVFRSSALCQHLERNFNQLGDGVLLGDSGYACMKFLMTPYRNSDTPSKERYNRAHCRTRVTIEMAFGSWKRRFGILHGEVRLTPEKASKVIIACAVLHNIAIIIGEPDDHSDDMNVEPPQPEAQFEGPDEGNQIRDYITRHYF